MHTKFGYLGFMVLKLWLRKTDGDTHTPLLIWITVKVRLRKCLKPSSEFIDVVIVFKKAKSIFSRKPIIFSVTDLIYRFSSFLIIQLKEFNVC